MKHRTGVCTQRDLNVEIELRPPGLCAWQEQRNDAWTSNDTAVTKAIVDPLTDSLDLLAETINTNGVL